MNPIGQNTSLILPFGFRKTGHDLVWSPRGATSATTVNFIFVTISPVGLVRKNYSAGAKLLAMVATEFFLRKMNGGS
jgi:hypothetical protein